MALATQNKAWCNRGNAFTYQSPCLIIVLNYDGATVPALFFLHQLPRHRVPVLNIVAAASPLELLVLADRKCLVGKVVVCRVEIISRERRNDIVGKDLLFLLWSHFAAPTLVKMTHAARSRDRKSNPGRCDGIDERRLSVV